MTRDLVQAVLFTAAIPIPCPRRGLVSLTARLPDCVQPKSIGPATTHEFDEEDRQEWEVQFLTFRNGLISQTWQKFLFVPLPPLPTKECKAGARTLKSGDRFHYLTAPAHKRVWS